MAMNVRTSIEASVNLISTPEQMEEMTALAYRFGFRLQFDADPERKGWVARLTDAGDLNYPHASIMALVLLRAIGQGTSVEKVLEEAKRDLIKINVNVETIATAIVSKAPEDAVV
ncbi:hypothetical protein ACVWY0_001632 [Arthrobacter sp. UYNi723]